MRIRESLTKGLLIALALTLIPVSAISAQKITPGSNCKVYGQKVTNQSKVFTCIKSGKKLIWNKGISTPTPKVTPTPIPTPTPTPTATPAPVESQSQEDVKNIGILKNSLIQIRSYTKPNENLYKTLYLDPRVSSIPIEWIKNSQDNVLDAMGGLLVPSTRLFSTIAFDAQFVSDTYPKIESITGTQPGYLARNNASPLANCISGCAFSSLVFAKIEFPTLIYVKPTANIDAKELGAHETFHVIQNSLDSVSGNLPCWIHEGQASFVGTAFAEPTESYDSTIKMIRAFGGMHSAGSDLSKIEAPQGWSGWHGSCMDVGEYQVGRIANAYLVGKFGWQKSLDFLKAMNGQPADGISWKVAFEQIFHQSVADFYVDAELFIDWFFKKYIP
jgi:hypothetical protein